MKLNIKLLTPEAKIPKYATDGSGCFDLYATSEGTVMEKMSLIIHTGLSVEVPKGQVMLIFSRSGQGFNNNVRLSNCVGVIDSDYRGEVMIKLASDDPWRHHPINVGDRVAQAMLFPYEQVEFNVLEELEKTERGENGFGSTGV